ncbi:MAG: phosphoglycerate dehydrogenase [Gemmatimonadetes bacterium]|nr:phosphoglycerate dehydrogenase [Gemmatimonadota bacterium]
MKRAAIINDNPQRCLEVYGSGRYEQLTQICDLIPGVLTAEQVQERLGELSDVEVVFSTWGYPVLDTATLDAMPHYRALFYAAGSVKSFAPALLERDITVVSGWAANGVPVAEFTVAQILLACKGYFRNTRDFSDPSARSTAHRGAGVFGETVGLIGVGMAGRAVVELLRPFVLRVVVHDPFLSDNDAAQLGVEKVSLEELFAQSYVVSNHLPNLPELQGVLHGGLLEQLRPDATFINTGRGAQVVEADMMRIWSARPDLTALLDVTMPEPPEEGSRFYEMPNVHLSTHIAGSMNDEIVRMADYMIEDFRRWEEGVPLNYQVTPERLETMA